MQKWLNLIAGILFLVAFVPYIRAIIKKQTKPAKASWLIWASMDTVLFLGMLSQHAINGQIIGAICGAWTVFILAMKYGVPGWSKIDKICLGGTILALLLWKISGNATVGIATSLVSGILGSVPTFINAWQDASRENKTAWTIYWLSCLCAIGAVPKWTLADAGQPITFLLIESAVMFALFVRPCLARLSK